VVVGGDNAAWKCSMEICCGEFMAAEMANLESVDQLKKEGTNAAVQARGINMESLETRWKGIQMKALELRRKQNAACVAVCQN
jgi:hypothetical protein